MTVMTDKIYQTIYLGRAPTVPLLNISRLHAALFVGALAIIGLLLASDHDAEETGQTEMLQQ